MTNLKYHDLRKIFPTATISDGGYFGIEVPLGITEEVFNDVNDKLANAGYILLPSGGSGEPNLLDGVITEIIPTRTFRVREVSPTLFPPLTSIATGSGGRFLTKGGKSYPSVSSVMTAMMPEENRLALAAWRAERGEDEANRLFRESTEVGLALHALLKLYISGVPDWQREVNDAKLCAISRGLVVAINSNLDNIVGFDLPLFSDRLQVAGRVNCVGTWGGKLAVVEFKNSREEKPSSVISQYALQAAVYAILFSEQTGVKIPKIVVAIALWDGTSQIFEADTDDYREMAYNTLAEYRRIHNQATGQL